MASTAPATHSQPSRKGKKAWRKNVDISEIQQGLEATREEIIKTGGIIAEKAAEELFATDTIGDAKVEEKQKGKKLLKADEILALRSAVPGLDGRKRKADESAAIASSTKRQKNGKYVPHKELQHLKNIADGLPSTNRLTVSDEPPAHDPWAASTTTQDPQLSFVPEAQTAKEPKTLKHAPTPLSATHKPLPSIPKPHAGKSYNPLVTDWTALLEREGAAAVAAEQDRLHNLYLAEEQDRKAAAEAAKVEAQEKQQFGVGVDYDSAWESEWEGFQSEGEREKEVFTVRVKGRKTPGERKKVVARKEREARAVHERKIKEREWQERRIREIAREVSAREKGRKGRGVVVQAAVDSEDESMDDDAGQHLQRNRFGKVPVPDAPLEVVLPDELEDSLRRLKPEGDLMQERYRTLLVNGKVESRRKRWQYKQAKTTRSEKWSYKDWKLK